MISIVKRNAFKIMECTAEYILYIPWMIYLYFLIFRKKDIIFFIPVLWAFMLFGLLINDTWLTKKRVLYKFASFILGGILSLVLLIILEPKGLVLSFYYTLFFFIFYVRGLSFAQHNIKTMYSINKFIFGIVILLLSYILSQYVIMFRWFKDLLIPYALVYIVLSIIILNQLQLIRMFDLMNAESIATHKSVRIRNFLFSLGCSALIIIIFEFKNIVNILNSIVSLAMRGLRFLTILVLKWIISMLGKTPPSKIKQSSIKPPDMNMLPSSTTSHWGQIIKVVLEVGFYAITIAAIMFILYHLIKAFIKWLNTFMKSYIQKEDEERSFIISWDEVVENGKNFGRNLRRRLRNFRRNFKSPHEHIRFLYKEVILRLIRKNKELDMDSIVSCTPNEIHSIIKEESYEVDPDFKDLTELYQEARYSKHQLNNQDVTRAKNFKERLFKIKVK